MVNHYLNNILHTANRDFGQTAIIWQILALGLALGLAYGLAHWIRSRMRISVDVSPHRALYFGAQTLNKALFPLLGWLIVTLSQFILANFMSTRLLQLARVPLFGIALIYITLYVARRIFGWGGRAQSLLLVVEKGITILVWIGMVLTVLGVQDDLLRWMDSVRFNMASAHMSLLSLGSGFLWVCITLIVALWFGSLIEERLMRSSRLDANLKVALTRLGNAALIVAALLFSLSLVGIDITILGVFGGALGVGLGFGLQKIASNYVSGFIILLDRSLRLGDMITMNGCQGVVHRILTRYTVVRSLDGTDTLVPNEKLITDTVQNHSAFLTRGFAKISLQVTYLTDIDLVLKLMLDATHGVKRVLQDPAPGANLAGFSADGMDIELGFWIDNVASGTSAVRSEVNQRIWKNFTQHGIKIACAQRELNILHDQQTAISASVVRPASSVAVAPI